VYNKIRRLKTLEEVEKYFPGFMALTDSIEQQIQSRAVDKRKKNFYSGEKKRHAVKNQISVNSCVKNAVYLSVN
jgi:hypothetical protein